MSDFFNKNTYEAIKKNESNPKKILNFIPQDFCKELLDFRNSRSKKMVDREESTKVPFLFDESSITQTLKNKIKETVGEFFIKDFEPHFITTRFPLRLHADTGKDPNDIIFKNIVIPLEINHNEEKNKKNSSHTIIFKNKWYEQSAIFTTKTTQNYDFIIKDYKGNFTDIINIFDFKEKVDQKNNEILKYKNNDFFVDQQFKEYVLMLSKTKRYNRRTDKHILHDTNIKIEDYEKYMTHQPFEDCKGLEIDCALAWEPGALLTWDRVRIHSSDNFLKNGIINKTCIALFSSK
jgi:hypothetical protein